MCWKILIKHQNQQQHNPRHILVLVSNIKTEYVSKEFNIKFLNLKQREDTQEGYIKDQRARNHKERVKTHLIMIEYLKITNIS